MEEPGLRQRNAASASAAGRATSPPSHLKPTGHEHTLSLQIVRGILLFTWMNTCCTVTHVTQLAGAWLYFVSKDMFYGWMTWTKESFGLLIITITQWFAPMPVRISGSRECRAQMKVGSNGLLDTSAFPERLVLIANHQLYSDWLFLWWVAYTARLHGYIYIILKDSLKWIPVIGPGMQFYRFIFVARNWAKDKARLQYRLRKLSTRRGVAATDKGGKSPLDPMWLLIFPEGTNLSANTRNRSKAFADKSGIEDLKHLLLPRSTGLQYCLQELKSSVEWVYDCTVAYEGIPHGQFGQDVYTNRGIYFGGRAPKSVNMHWRRFHMSTIPISSPTDFEAWIVDRWREKDALLEFYEQTGRFPADTDTPTSTPATSTILVKNEDGPEGDGDDTVSSRAWGGGSGTDGDADYLETEVKVSSILDILAIFGPLTAIGVTVWIITALASTLVK